MRGVTPDDELRAHAGVIVGPGMALPAGFDRVLLPGGRLAVLAYQGPYDGVPAAWDAAYRWLAGSEEAAGAAPPFERYLNDPDDTAPDDLLTEICVPLRG